MRLYKAPDTTELDAKIRRIEERAKDLRAQIAKLEKAERDLYEERNALSSERNRVVRATLADLPTVPVRPGAYALDRNATPYHLIRWTKASVWLTTHNPEAPTRFSRRTGVGVGGSTYRSARAKTEDIERAIAAAERGV